ncbi:DUF6114 domain-containing protein [Catellatospora tritici]|uniref:DUF6114 domain-containing protein n=1 Tax=Catellatospora tritici TaxID=2851566 RepID=UPI001C2CE169|nr:DUF6114 domain-containing protein [Catellatospora tritici]MBV1853366.1 hypothetical protein [Catellatospora tritici]
MNPWQRLNAWRRSRPYWGGMFLILAGIEIMASTKMTLDGATISVGVTGLQALLIPFILVVAGLLAWFSPAQRMFYGLIGVFVAIYSLIAINLGGWFVGTIFGIVGGGLVFAWNPASDKGDRAEGDDEPNSDDGGHHADVNDLLDGPMTDTLPPAVNPLRDGVPAQRQPYGEETPDTDRRNGPRHAAMGIVVATLAASMLGVVVAQQPARAAECGTVAAAAGPVRTVVGGLLTTMGQLLGVAATPSPSASPTPCPTDSPEPSPSPSTEAPEPSASPSPKPSASPEPSGSPTAKPSPDESEPAPTSPTPTPSPTAKRLQAAKGQPLVAERASLLTGTRVTMYNLVFDGIVQLPTQSGTVEVLQFSMSQSDTVDFKLHVYGKGGADQELTTPKLTVKGDTVKFYTSRFRGNLLGLIPVDYSPTSLPPNIPLPLVFFTDPVIDLVFVDSPVLTAPDLKVTTL